MFVDEYNICQLIDNKQWNKLEEALSQIFSSHSNRSCEKYILFLDTCVDYYIHGCPFKPSAKRHVRAILRSGLETESQYISILSKDEIENFASVICNVTVSCKDGKLKTLLELLHKHIYIAPEDISSDILSRYIDYFEESSFRAPVDSIDEFSIILNRYCIQLKEDWGKVSFSEHNYVIKRLLYLCSLIRNNNETLDSMQKEAITQTVNDSVTKLSQLRVNIKGKEFSIHELIEFMYETDDSIFLLNIDRMSYGYNPVKKQIQLTLIMNNS